MPLKLSPLNKKFYLRDTLTISRELLGKILVRKVGNKILTGKIVETEAYIGAHDPACHAYGRVTERNRLLYEEGGISYVYFIYGNYNCFNAVTESKGEGSAVLIRAVEPMHGIKTMQALRKMEDVETGTKKFYELTNGPGKLCIAMDIDRSLNKLDITKPNKIYIAKLEKKENSPIIVSKRIGINVGVNYPYRFFIKDNPFVTRHKFNKEILEEIY